MSLQDVHVTREMLSPLISWIWFLTAEKLLDGVCEAGTGRLEKHLPESRTIRTLDPPTRLQLLCGWGARRWRTSPRRHGARGRASRLAHGRGRKEPGLAVASAQRARGRWPQAEA